MYNNHAPGAPDLLMNYDFKVYGSAPAFYHIGVKAVRQIQDLFLFLKNCVLCFYRVMNVDKLDLSNENGIIRLGLKSPRLPHNLGRRTDSRQYRRLLHNHWNDIGFVIYHKVEPESHGQSEYPHYVFYHSVSFIYC